MMGLIKDRHGTYYAQRKVPPRLQEAVARLLNSDRHRQVFLKKSLGTKSLKEANVAATHVLAGFNRTIADRGGLAQRAAGYIEPCRCANQADGRKLLRRGVAR